MNGQRRRASRQEVAQQAGVSPATVSLVLNGRGDQSRIARRTQDRVREVAEQLRYIPTFSARYRTLGLVAHRPQTMHAPIFEEVATAAIDEAAQHGYNVKFLPPVTKPEEYDVAAALREAYVDAVMVHNLPWLAQQLADWSMPVIYTGSREGAKGLPLRRIGAVTVDESAGLRDVARHLLARGHTDVAILGGRDQGPSNVIHRLSAFADEFLAQRDGRASVADAIRTYPVPDMSPDGGYRAMQALFANRTRTTAVHAATDRVAVGALRAAHENGLRIPADMEIVGFGDFVGSAYLEPPLTTVRWPLGMLGERAVRKLVSQLTEQSGGRGHVSLRTELIIRGSSPPVESQHDDHHRGEH